MNYVLYTILLCSLLIGCTNDTPRTMSSEKKQEVIINSQLFFKMDYSNWEMDKEQDFNKFQELLATKNAIRVDNINIRNGTNEIYSFSQNLGDLVITKNAQNEYVILEHYIVPIGSVYGKVALLRYLLNPRTGSIKRDKTFRPQLRIYKYWSNHIVKEYDSYLTDPDFTTKNIDKIPFRAFETMRYLMFNLTLARVLENCQACEDRMKQITTDYSFVASKIYFEQNLFVCNTILEKIKD